MLILSHDPNVPLKRIQASYNLIPDSIGPPSCYLGANIRRVVRPGGDASRREYWSISAHIYVKNAVRNVKLLLLKEEGRGLKSTAKSPFSNSSYRPEVDTSDKCDNNGASQYSQLIGVLRWAVELGRIDIYTEVASLPQHLALPHIGHLEAVYHGFACLNKHEKSTIIFDPTDPLPNTPTTAKPDWTPFYSNPAELLPQKMAEPLGHPVYMYTFVDANHAGNVVTRRSHTGILLFVQNSPILRLSRQQNTVETSTFDSKFVAMRTACDMIIAQRYK